MNIPFYIQVAETIRRRILSDEYGHGDILPSSDQLEKEFRVSAITVRKALEILAGQGVIRRRRGVGTTANKPGSEKITFNLGGTFRRFVDSLEKELTSFEVLDMTSGSCPLHVREQLSLDADRPVLNVKKIRMHEGTPVGYYLLYSDARLCKGITRRKVEEHKFLELFEKGSGIKLDRMEQNIKVAIADIDLSAALRTDFGSPLFYTENIFFDNRSRPVILIHIYYRGDKCSYKADVKL